MPFHDLVARGGKRALAARVLALLAALAPAAAFAAGGQGKAPAEAPKGSAARPAQDPRAVEVCFTDDSTLKLTLRDERLELITPYGPLWFPVGEVRRIEFALRLSPDVARRIDAAVADLGSPESRRRDAAGAALLALRDRAYPALLRAAKHKDKAVAGRANELLHKLRDAVPEERLKASDYDLVYTDDSKFGGRVNTAVLTVDTFQFGELRLKLADVRSLRSLTAEPAEPANVLPDPGNLVALQDQVGKVFHFKVTGAAGGTVWGTDVYTSDSPLATAAVHAGVLKVGETGVVKVTVVAPPPSFDGSTRNGVSTSAYGPWSGAYQVGR
jgi:hypothetical protein